MMPSTEQKPREAWIGLDVAKANFEAALALSWEGKESYTESSSFPRTPAGAQKCLAWIDRKLPLLSQELHLSPELFSVRAVMEATGHYSEELCRWFIEARPELSPAIANPLRVHYYAQSLGIKNKTDSIDAGMLARFGLERQPKPWEAPTPEQAKLRSLVRARQDLVKMQSTARILVGETASMPEIQAIHQALLADLVKRVRQVEELIAEHIKKSPKLAQDVARLMTIPGFGLMVSATLLGELGDLRRFQSRRQISAFAGVNPVIKSSGATTRRCGISKAGPADVRRVLYMAALAAKCTKVPNCFGAFYQKKIDEGRKPLMAATAVMHKMLITARALLVNETDFSWSHA
jgi:transposase